MKLFQNLYTGLAEENFLLFIALVANLFNRAEHNYFKIHLLVQKKSFKGFLFFLALVAILFNGAKQFE